MCIYATSPFCFLEIILPIYPPKLPKIDSYFLFAISVCALCSMQIQRRERKRKFLLQIRPPPLTQYFLEYLQVFVAFKEKSVYNG